MFILSIMELLGFSVIVSNTENTCRIPDRLTEEELSGPIRFPVPLGSYK